MEKQKNNPALRFPEYNTEWEKKRLCEIFEISAGGDISNDHVKQNKDEVFKYPIYANAEKDKGFYGYSDIYKIDENVITIAGRGVNIGIAHARNHKFYPIVRLLVLKPKNNENIYFFEYQINRLNLFKESTGVPQLTAPQVSNYEVLFPNSSEQQKIAAFLTSVDERIAQLTKKKTLLEQYKKGVMQKIFSQEIRFKDDNGKEFGEWRKEELGNLIIECVNKTTESGQYPILSSTKDGIFYQSEYFNREVASNDNTGYKILKKNQLVYSPQNLWLGNININSKIDIGIVSPSYKICDFVLSKVNIDFFKHIIKTPRMMFEYAQASEQGASVVRRNLNIELFNNIKVDLPSLQEQEVIANFLSAIDKKIEGVDKQLEQTKLWKKGLLQQMFC